MRGKKEKVIIVGAGEQAQVIFAILKDTYTVVGFLDDNVSKARVLGPVKEYVKYIPDRLFFVAFGDIYTRKQAYLELKKAGAKFVNAIHKNASIEESVVLGENVFIGEGSYINIRTVIGNNVFINNRCIVEHDNHVGDHAHLTPGTVTGGGVSIGESCFLGLRSVINDHLTIGDYSVIGSGSVVTRNIEQNVTAVGVPAKTIKVHRVDARRSKDSKIKRVIFLARKPTAYAAVEYLLGNGIEVPLIVAPEEEQYDYNRLKDLAAKYTIPLYFDPKPVYDLIARNDPLVRDIDLVISYLFWKRIKRPLISLGKYGCINFHPAPLPDYKSRAGYNNAILEGKKEFGVSAHFIDSEAFDAGPIIEVFRFPFDPETETAFSLSHVSQQKLLDLFKKTLDRFIRGEPIPREKNEGGLYMTKESMEDLKKVDLIGDTQEEIHRKIRAFFFPPYNGAKVNIKGEEFTLVDKQVLGYLYTLLKQLKK